MDFDKGDSSLCFLCALCSVFVAECFLRVCGCVKEIFVITAREFGPAAREVGLLDGVNHSFRDSSVAFFGFPVRRLRYREGFGVRKLC